MFLEDGFDLPKIEEKILAFWDEQKTFEKTLEKTKDGKPFTFYDGPPFATGIPHYGHILASTVKDLVGRYQTMRGRYVRRRWGWDCHGLPIEEIVERKLGISGKKQIEEIGIGKFNETCRSTVLQYVEEWGKMVRRIARWVDFDNSYKTMDRDYMESVWWAFKQIYDEGLVYEGRKVLLYCPRCETPISNFEVAMDNSYKEVTEEAVIVKFRVKQKVGGGRWEVGENTYLLAWTTTPWTLPGNVALAVGEKITYAIFSDKRQATSDKTFYIAAKDRLDAVAGTWDYEIVREISGAELAGLEYEPLFDLTQTYADSTRTYADKIYRVYAADFVNTEEGTGIVHTAVVYGEDDYALGLREGLPVVPLLDEKGIFNGKAPELVRGQYFKDAEKLIKRDLEARRLLLERKMHQHSYPHCWRCGTALFYNAIPAWFVNIQKIKKDLLASNDKEVSWYPDHLKHGRYEKSVEAAPDWNISRNRYWGNPIPVWKCESCLASPDPAKRDGAITVVGRIKELGLGTNTFYFARHGETETNVRGIINCELSASRAYDLTAKGEREVRAMAEQVKAWGGVDVIYASDFLRTKRTAEIAGEMLGAPVRFDPRLREYHVGVWEGKSSKEFEEKFPYRVRWEERPEGGETHRDLQARMVEFVAEVNREQSGKRILVVSHGDPLLVLQKHFGSERGYPQPAEPFALDVSVVDLHRPFIDEVVLACNACGGKAKRIPEVFDSWVEAGSMPFAEYHYPFENRERFPDVSQKRESGSRPEASGESAFPAQFVAEYIAQTRAWFYLMHVMSFSLFGKAPFENVVTTGTILAEDGSKMSKSKSNFPDPWKTIEKYGVDSLRFYLMSSVVMQAENLNFSEQDLGKTHRKNVLILWNVFNYYRTYVESDKRPARTTDLRSGGQATSDKDGKDISHVAVPMSLTVLDKWINARTQELVNDATKYLDAYDTVRAARAIEQYIDDLSTWYVRRSRGRTDEGFFATLYSSLLTTSKIIAPFMPYMAELIFQEVRQQVGGGRLEVGEQSVHLEDWPKAEALTDEGKNLLRDMETVREAASAGLALRKAANIPVRQPLTSLKIRNPKLEIRNKPEMLEILKNELNVRNVIFDSSIREETELDTAMTDELRHEGLVREIERFVQEMRKTNGFKVGEMAKLAYATSDEELERALLAINRRKTYVAEIGKGKGSDVQETFTHEGHEMTVWLTRG